MERIYQARGVIQNKKQTVGNVDDRLVELIEILEEINEAKAALELNEISILGRKGGRIYF